MTAASFHQVRRRIAGICQHRRRDLQTLDLFVVTSPSLRLDSAEEQARLDTTLADLRPRLLLLDPSVRLHHIDENSAAEISALLGVLRHLQRKYKAAIAVVHHVGKRSHSHSSAKPCAAALTSAWSDSAAYLVRKRDRLELTLEHRSAPAPDPFAIELVGDDPDAAHLLSLNARCSTGASDPR